MGWGMEHLQGHAAWIWTYSMDIEMDMEKTWTWTWTIIWICTDSGHFYFPNFLLKKLAKVSEVLAKDSGS
jgi:hypothetical protein